VAKKGTFQAVVKMNIGLDAPLAKAVEASANRYERNWNEEVRFALKEYYGLHEAPAEVRASVSA
jgi:hypothetical protein